MNKILHLNSFFTKIILAVLSFAVIVCIFIPYMIIPAVDAVQDVDVQNKKLELFVGKDKPVVNVISDFGNGQPYVIYEDEQLTRSVEKTSIPVSEKSNTYYLATYAYGYDVNNGATKLDYVLLDVYPVTFTKDTRNDSPALTKYNTVTKKIEIRVPNATAFDFTRVIDPRKSWVQYGTKFGGTIEGAERTDANRDKYEVTSLNTEEGKWKNYYIAITLRSEVDPTLPETDNPGIYYSLNVYTLTIYRDPMRRTLPTVGEVGMGLMSYLRKSADTTVQAATTYGGDAIMFTFMILAAVCTLGALITPNKFKIVEMILASILGIALIAMPNLDYFLYFGAKGYQIEPGYYVLIVLGVLIILMGVFDWYRCRSEYREEQIRIYGEDVFKKK